MAKKRDRKAILSSIPNYVGNVTKSVLYSGMDILEDIAPETSQFVTSTSDLSKSMMEDGKRYSMSVTNYLRTFKNSETFKDLNDIKKNALSDLKTGKFNNKQRANDMADSAIAAGEKDMMESMGFDFDFSDDGASDEDIINKMMGGSNSKPDKTETTTEVSKDGSSTTNTVNNLSINNITSTSGEKSALQGIASLSRIGAAATIQATKAQISNDERLHSIKMVTGYRMFEEVSSRLHEMSGYLKGLFDYTANLTTHMQTTTKYYDDTKTSYDTIIAGQKRMMEITEKMFIGKGEEKDDKDYDKLKSGDILMNGFNIENYIKMVKKNAKNEKDNNLMFSMLNFGNEMADMTGQSLLQMLASSPLDFLSKGMADFAMKPAKDSIKGFNETFKNFFKSASVKYSQKASESDIPILNILGNIFGIKADKKESVNTGEFVKGPIPFDGYVKHAIVDVIPTYLRKILAAITGGSEKVFDYESGKFTTKKKIQKSHDDSIDYTYDNMQDMKYSISDKMRNLGLDSTTSEDILKDFKTLTKFIVDEKHFFNPMNDTYEKLNGKGLNVSNQENYDILRNLIASEDKSKIMGLNGSIYESAEKHNDYITNLNKNLGTSGKSLLFNDADEGDITDSKGGIVTPIKAMTSLFIDKHKKSVVDYLRDVKTILESGIRVFDAGKIVNENTTVSETAAATKQLSTYVNEIGKHKNKDKSRSNSGAETYGSDYVDTQTRNSKLKDRIRNMSGKGINEYLKELKDREDGTYLQSSSEDNGPKSLKDSLKQFIQLPAATATSFIKMVDEGMFGILYDQEMQKKGGSFIKDAIGKINKKFTDIKELITEKILEPLKEKLFGEKGIITNLKNKLSPKFGELKDKMSLKFLGKKNDQGIREGGYLSTIANYASDGKDSILNYFTGKGYTSKISGKVIEARENSVLTNVKDMFGKVKEHFAVSLFGNKNVDEDGNIIEGRDGKGIIPKMKGFFTDTFSKVKEQYFGGKAGDTVGDIKQSMPKILAGMGIGGAGALFSTLFLPMGIGLVPSLLLGGAGGFISSNEKAKKWLFGDEDSEGKISKKFQSGFKKYFPSIASGTAIGGILGTFTGNPLIGPMLGASIGYATKSEGFKKFLFGDGTDDNKGIISKELIEKTKKYVPGGALGAGVGLLGSFFLPGGPIVGSILGFATGMGVQSENVKKFLFGDMNPDTDKREGGLFGKMRLFLQVQILEQAKLDILHFTGGLKSWFTENIGNRIKSAIKPFTEEVKRMGKNLFGAISGAISKTFENSVGIPLKSFIDEKILNPFKNVFNKIFGAIGKVVAMPFKMIENKATDLAAKHKALGMDYVSQWRKDKKDREIKVKNDRKLFNKDIADRREKLGQIQTVMSDGGYDIKDKGVKAAWSDYNNKYKGDKYKDFSIKTYETSKFINQDTNKMVDLLGKVKTGISDMVGFFKDKFNDGKEKIKEKALDANAKLKNKINGVAVNAKYLGIKARFGIEDYIDDLKEKKDNAKDWFSQKRFNPGIAAIRNRKLNEDTEEVNNGGVNFVNLKDYKLKPVSKKEEKAIKPVNIEEDRTRPPKEKEDRTRMKTGKIQDAKVKGTIFAKDITTIKNDIKTISREVYGQLDGVGHNIHGIKMILEEMSGITKEGKEMRGNKKRSFFNRLKNAIMRPFDTITSVVREKIDKVTGVIGNTIKAFGTGVKNTFNVLKSLGSVIVKTINTGVKVVGTLATTTIKTVGSVLTTATKAIGAGISGILTGLGKSIGYIAQGIGKGAQLVIEGFGALGKGALNLVSGLASLTGSLLNVGGKLIKGVTNLTASLIKSTATLIKGIAKTAWNVTTSIIKAPFKMVGKMFNRAKLGGNPVHVVNFKNFLDMASASPMAVRLEGGYLDNVNNVGNVGATQPNLGNDVAIASTALDIKEHKDKSKKDKDGGDSSDDEAAPSKKNKLVQLPEKIDNLTNKLTDLLSGKKRKPKAGNNDQSSTDKLFKDAKTDVYDEVGKMMNTETDPSQQAASINDISKGNPVTQAMVQSAEANKGVFGLLAKVHGKKGLFSKMGGLLILALPKILGFFGKLKALGLKGIVAKIGSGISGFFSKGAKSLSRVLMKPFTLFGKIFGKGIDVISKGIAGLIKVIIGKKAYDKFGSKLNGFKDKLDRRRNRRGGAVELAEEAIGGVGVPRIRRNGKFGTGTNPVRLPKTNISSAGKLRPRAGTRVRARGVKGKLGALGAVAKGVLGSSARQMVSGGLDLGQIDDMMTVNGNVAIIANGGVSGLGGSNGVAGALADGAGEGVIDLAEQRLKRRGKQGAVDLAENTTQRAVGETIENGAGRTAGKFKGKINRPNSATVQGLGGAATEAVENTATNVGSTVANVASRRMPSVLGGSGLAGLAGRFARQNDMGFVGTVGLTMGAQAATPMLESLIQKVLGSKVVVNAFGKHANVLAKVGKFLVDKLGKIGVKKLPVLIGKLTAKAGAMVGGAAATFGILPAVMIGYDAVSGATEVQRIMHINKDSDITMSMRLACSLAKLLDNNITFGFIDIGTIATFIYGLIANKDEEAKLAQQQNDFEAQYNEYVEDQEAQGQEAMSFEDYNADQNKSMFGKIGSGIKSGFNWVGDKLGWVGDKAKQGLGWIGDKTKQGLGWVGDKAKQGLGWVKEKLGTKEGKAMAVGGLLGGLPGLALGKLFGKKKDNKDKEDMTTSQGQPIPISAGTLPLALANDLGTLTGGTDESGNPLENIDKSKMELKKYLSTVESTSKLSMNLLNKTEKQSMMVMQKSNDVMANTASQYGTVAGNATHLSTMLAEGNAHTNMGAPVLSTAAAPQKQSVFSKIGSGVKSIATKIGNGIKGLFGGFGSEGGSVDPNGPNTTDLTQAQQQRTMPGVKYLNGMVYFSQSDPRWSEKPYNAPGYSGKTMHTSACGPTSMAMVTSSLTGKYVDPVQAADWSVKNGFRTPSSGTSWDFFGAFGKTQGVDIQSIGTDRNKLKEALQQRKPVIMSGTGKKPFTSGGHFIVAAGISPDGNQILVNDPVSEGRSVAYPVEHLLQFYRNGWAASVNGKGLSGSNPAITGGPNGEIPAGAPGAPGTAPQEDNSILGLLSQLGGAVTGYADATARGKVYEAVQTPETGGQAADGTPLGTPTSVNGIPIGTQALAPSLTGEYRPVFEQAGKKYGVEPQILQAISMQESSGNPRCGYSNQPAWGLMQIENTLKGEFGRYGRETAGAEYTLQDRLIPQKAVPFGAKRFSDDLKHYNGDYLKTIQAYNFSKYSLDKLIAKFPNNWMEHRAEMGQYNGVGGSYGDKRYIENVLRYYHGNAITAGKGSQPQGGEGGSSGELDSYYRQQEREARKQNKDKEANIIKSLRQNKQMGSLVSNLMNKANPNTDVPAPNVMSGEQINKFVKNSYSSVSNEVNDLLTASELRSTEQSSTPINDFSELLSLVREIAGNTASTASNTGKIAEKEFTVNNNTTVNSIPEQKQQHNTTVNNTSVNPFTDMSKNDSVSSKIERGYNMAKRIAQK